MAEAMFETLAICLLAICMWYLGGKLHDQYQDLQLAQRRLAAVGKKCDDIVVSPEEEEEDDEEEN